MVRIVLPNPGEKFKFGMFVNVAFSTVGGREKTNAVVPESAVQLIGNESVVFKKTSDPLKFVIQRVIPLQKKSWSISLLLLVRSTKRSGSLQRRFG